MRRLYAFSNRNPPLPVQAYEDDRENVRIIRREQTTNDNTTIVRKTVNQVENYDTDVRYVQNENVYLNESARCPYVRFPWWLWLLLGLGLLTLLALGLGLGLGLGLKKSSVNSRCSGNTCPSNSQCINNRCECNSGYFYDYTISMCSAYRHVGMTCSTSYTSQQCVANANCASNGYCVCNTGYFLDQNNGVCTALLARYTPCASDDQCQTPFVCRVSLCDCNQTSYYDSGSNTCKRLAYPNEPCSLNSQCIRTANCSTVTCQCPADHYFDNTAYQCIEDQFIGQSCTQNYQCITNAFCDSVSPFSNQCECNTGLYYDTSLAVCSAQLTHLTACTDTYSCVNNLICLDDSVTAGTATYQCVCLPTQYYLPTNQTCIPFATYNEACSAGGRPCETRYGLSCSVPTSTCQCSSINYWNGTTCIPRLYPGQTCSSTAQCINSSSCVSSVCTCDTDYYYSTLVGECVPQLSYSTSCTLGNYQCLNNTLCYNLLAPPATCSCNLTLYYYDGTQCASYATFGQTCAAAIYGPLCDSTQRSLVCINSVCTCLSTSYYNGSSCVPYTQVGYPCTSSVQCIGNSTCSSLQVCTCISSTYFNAATGTCLTLLTFGQVCAASSQCTTNMICTLGKCVCTANSYFSSPNCVTSVSYGGACSATVLCDTTTGLVCTSSVCTCSATQFWSTSANGSQTCANLRTLGQSCSASTDCANSATSVKCVSSICECDSSGYYLDQVNVVCLPLKAIGVACTPTYNFQCASFNCAATNLCGTAIASTIYSNVTQATSVAVREQYQPGVVLLMCFLPSMIHR